MRLAALCLAAAALAFVGCGDSADEGPLGMAELGESVEREAAEFLERPGSALGVSLREFLGPKIATEVESGSAICRRGRDTPSIEDPRRYPFACVVSGSADGEGLLVEITLGFVGTGIDGRCWKAVNERVLVTTTRPHTLTKPEATRPPNRLQGCA